MNSLKIAERFILGKKIIWKNLRLLMLKTIKTIEPYLMCKITKIKRTEYKAQKYTQVYKSI